MEVASKYLGMEDWSSEENRDEDTELGAMCMCGFVVGGVETNAVAQEEDALSLVSKP